MGPTWLDVELARLDVPDHPAAYRQAAERLASTPEPQAWRTLFDRAGAIGGAGLTVAGVLYLVAFNWAALGPLSKLSFVAGVLTLCALVGLVAGNRRAVGSVALAATGGMVGPLLALHSQLYQTGADAWSLFAGWFILFLPWAALSRRTGVWLGALVLLQVSVATATEHLGGDVDVMLLAVAVITVPWWWVWTAKNPASGYPRVAATLGWLALLGASSADLVANERYFGPGTALLLLVVLLTQARFFGRDLFLVAGSAATLCAWATCELLYGLVSARVDGMALFFFMSVWVLLQAACLGAWIRVAQGENDALDA